MEVNIIRSNRKTIAIQVNPDCTVTVRAPKRIATRDIEQFVHEKEPWIRKHLAQMKERQAQNPPMEPQALTKEVLEELTARAKEYIPDRVAYFAKIVGVDYGRITIRHQKTRWGSCSSKGNLNFNCLLMRMPPEVIDYVVVHELCHRKEMNHSKAFWHEVEKVLPDYKRRRQWLKQGRSF
ncbi:MAG: M48 family metallopeptidase [Agathobacter sp.]|nr:M48 family metallopeptidase [Agathobacter sp.]